MKEIPLTQGQVALVDDEDYDFLAQWKWHAYWDANTRSYRASRGIWDKEAHRATTVEMSRAIMSAPRGSHVDHKDHETLNNQRTNLRVCSPTQNQGNRRMNHNNTSGFTGVCAERGRWSARIRVKGRGIFLGYYDTKDAAAVAYNEAALAIWGDFFVRERIA